MDSQFTVVLFANGETDALAVERELQQHWSRLVFRHVTNKHTLHDALCQSPPVVLIDAHVQFPEFDAFQALMMARTSSPRSATIILSHPRGEEVAVEYLKCGASDYISKDNLCELSKKVRDAIKRERIEHRTRDGEALYRGLVENPTQGILVLDVDHVSFANQAACNMLGGNAEQLYRQGLLPLVVRRDRQRVKDALAGLISAQGGHTTLEFSIHDPEQQTRVLTAFLRSFVWRKRLMVQAALLDVTNERVAEAQLTQSQKLEAIGQLAAGIAHEINTPTQYVGDNLHFLESGSNALKAFYRTFEQDLARTESVETIRKRFEQLSKQADLEFLLEEMPQALEQARDGVRRISDIVRAMRDFSHRDGDEPEPTDINVLVQDTVIVARNEWKYCARLKRDLMPELPMVPVYPGEIGQVVLNLIVNAAHAVRDRHGERTDLGEITVSTRQDGHEVQIAITDNGVGIPREIRQRVFEPFFTTKKLGEGTGQGLAMAHRVIVERHRGSLTFDSKLGEGTTFSIRLPIVLSRSVDDTPLSENGV